MCKSSVNENNVTYLNTMYLQVKHLGYQSTQTYCVKNCLTFYIVSAGNKICLKMKFVYD